MSAYSIWPCFAVTAILLVLAATPLFRAADSPPNPHRVRISTLDGLRGFLALGVFFHHAAIYHQYAIDGRWQVPPSPFYTELGPSGVATFFMITGFLFWSRLVKEKGRPDWLQLYVGRLFRIAPLYLFAAASGLLIVLATTGLHLNVPLRQLAGELLHWAAVGLLNLTPVNGYAEAPLVLAAVTWTLRFEWLFYLSLPLLALVAGRTRLHLPFAAGALIVALAYVARHGGPDASPWTWAPACFLVGMTCGSLAVQQIELKLPNPVASLIVVLLLGAVFIWFNAGYNVVMVGLLGLAFYLINSGCSLFGLLTSRPARRLGDVSYGIYLLQGLVLTLVFANGRVRALAIHSPSGHWSVVLACAVLLLAIATATHVGIERAGIELGRRLGGELRKPRVLHGSQ